MTLAHGTDRLESPRLVMRRIAPDDLPFFTRLHALPKVAEHLYREGRPRSPEETKAWMEYTLASYEQLALGYLAVVRKKDGALIGRCGLMDLVVESAAPEHGVRRGWFGREQAPAGVALTFETELGYTFDPAVWGQGFATEAARGVRDYAREVLRLSYAVSAILPSNARSRRVAERSGARAAGQMEVVGLTWDRYVWPLDTGGAPHAPAGHRRPAIGRDINMDATKGFVVPAGGGKHLDMAAPGRFAALKLVGHETNESIMLFEKTVPVDTKSLFHLHRDSDEVAWVLAGEITFKIGDEVTVGGPGTCAFFPRNVPHAWKSTGSETGRVLFMYTPAAAGGYVEELLNHRPINDDERNQLRDRYHWEVVGPNPL
jgi:RimJ/RimL family protein N-acetyltransferase/mannose-6-phosphate isomerase-like protein (cupin superfamily)